VALQEKLNFKTGSLIVLKFCILTRKYRSVSDYSPLYCKNVVRIFGFMKVMKRIIELRKADHVKQFPSSKYLC